MNQQFLQCCFEVLLKMCVYFNVYVRKSKGVLSLFWLKCVNVLSNVDVLRAGRGERVW